MNILHFEIEKLLKASPLWVFLLICMLFNVFLIVVDSGRGSYAAFIDNISKETGIELGDNFNERLKQLSPNNEKNAAYLLQLMRETSGVKDVFDNYDASLIGESYIKALGIDGSLAKMIRHKYSVLQESIDKKAASNESLTLYFGSDTYRYHNLLFGGVMKWLLTEGILFASLAALLSVGFENINKTGQMVYSSKKGRQILVQKLSASVLTGLGAYLILTLLTLAVYFSFNSYGGILDSSVSSAFNYIRDLVAGVRPFSTWHSFTILTYLLAVIGASMGIILLFVLMAFAIGVLIKNSYIGFIAFLIANAAVVTLPFYLPSTNMIPFLLTLTPEWLWLKQSLWFTDGGMEALVPNFETVGIIISLALLSVFCIYAVKHFKRRDLI